MWRPSPDDRILHILGVSEMTPKSASSCLTSQRPGLRFGRRVRWSGRLKPGFGEWWPVVGCLLQEVSRAASSATWHSLAPALHFLSQQTFIEGLLCAKLYASAPRHSGEWEVTSYTVLCSSGLTVFRSPIINPTGIHTLCPVTLQSPPTLPLD